MCFSEGGIFLSLYRSLCVLCSPTFAFSHQSLDAAYFHLLMSFIDFSLHYAWSFCSLSSSRLRGWSNVIHYSFTTATVAPRQVNVNIHSANLIGNIRPFVAHTQAPCKYIKIIGQRESHSISMTHAITLHIFTDVSLRGPLHLTHSLDVSHLNVSLVSLHRVHHTHRM